MISRIAPALLAAAVALDAAAASVVPAEPMAFETVNLRLTVDSCTFVPSTVHVALAGNTFRVTQQMNACLAPGAAEVVDVRLGALPVGDYRVELYASRDTGVAPVEARSFSVRERVEVAVFPPPPRPLTGYTGLWWTPSESGWGLSLHHSATDVVFGAMFVYDANRNPVWYTLQGGQWTSATRWTGTVYRTTGPSFAGSGYDPRVVLVQPAGTATLEFRQVPGEEGLARFTYTVDGVTATKVITRMVF